MANSTIILSVGADTSQFSRDLHAAMASVKTSGAMDLKLRYDRTGFGQLSADASQVEKALQSATARVFTFGATLASMGKVVQTFKDITQNIVIVEKKLADINVVMNLSQRSLGEFGNRLFEIQKNTATAFDVVADAATEFSRQGLSMEETLKRTNDALILVRLSGLQAVDSVEKLTAAVNSFHDAGLTTQDVINKLAKVDADFAVSSKDLAEGLSRSSASAQDAKVSFDELLGVITSVQQQTARGGAVIGNSLKTIFTRIGTSDTIEKLRDLGVQIDETQTGMEKLKAVADRVKDLKILGNDTASTEIKKIVGGTYQINTLSALLRDMGKEYSLVQRAIRDQAEAQDEAYTRNERLNKTLDAQLKSLSTGFQRLSVDIGNNGIKDSMEGVIKTLDKVLDVADKVTNSSLGGSLIKGFSNFITGPGMLVAGLAGGKILKNTAKYSYGAVRELSGLDKEKDEKALRDQIVQNTLRDENQLLSRKLSLIDNEADRRKAIESYLRTELHLIEKIGQAQGKMQASVGVGIVGGVGGISGAIQNGGVGQKNAVDYSSFQVLKNSGTYNGLLGNGFINQKYYNTNGFENSVGKRIDFDRKVAGNAADLEEGYLGRVRWFNENGLIPGQRDEKGKFLPFRGKRLLEDYSKGRTERFISQIPSMAASQGRKMTDEEVELIRGQLTTQEKVRTNFGALIPGSQKHSKAIADIAEKVNIQIQDITKAVNQSFEESVKSLKQMQVAFAESVKMGEIEKAKITGTVTPNQAKYIRDKVQNNQFNQYLSQAGITTDEGREQLKKSNPGLYDSFRKRQNEEGQVAEKLLIATSKRQARIVDETFREKQREIDRSVGVFGGGKRITAEQLAQDKEALVYNFGDSRYQELLNRQQSGFGRRVQNRGRDFVQQSREFLGQDSFRGYARNALMLGGPIASGFADQYVDEKRKDLTKKDTDTTKGVSIAQQVLAGASTGALFGPWGALAGGAIAGTYSAVKNYGVGNEAEAERLNALYEQRVEKDGKLTNAMQAYLQVAEQLNQAIEQGSAAGMASMRRFSEQMAKLMQEIEDADGGENQAKIRKFKSLIQEGKTPEAQDIAGQIQVSRNNISKLEEQRVIAAQRVVDNKNFFGFVNEEEDIKKVKKDANQIARALITSIMKQADGVEGGAKEKDQFEKGKIEQYLKEIQEGNIRTFEELMNQGFSKENPEILTILKEYKSILNKDFSIIEIKDALGKALSGRSTTISQQQSFEKNQIIKSEESARIKEAKNLQDQLNEINSQKLQSQLLLQNQVAQNRFQRAQIFANEDQKIKLQNAFEKGNIERQAEFDYKKAENDFSRQVQDAVKEINIKLISQGRTQETSYDQNVLYENIQAIDKSNPQNSVFSDQKLAIEEANRKLEQEKASIDINKKIKLAVQELNFELQKQIENTRKIAQNFGGSALNFQGSSVPLQLVNSRQEAQQAQDKLSLFRQFQSQEYFKQEAKDQFAKGQLDNLQQQRRDYMKSALERAYFDDPSNEKIQAAYQRMNNGGIDEKTLEGIKELQEAMQTWDEIFNKAAEQIDAQKKKEFGDEEDKIYEEIQKLQDNLGRYEVINQVGDKISSKIDITNDRLNKLIEETQKGKIRDEQGQKNREIDAIGNKKAQEASQYGIQLSYSGEDGEIAKNQRSINYAKDTIRQKLASQRFDELELRKKELEKIKQRNPNVKTFDDNVAAARLHPNDGIYDYYRNLGNLNDEQNKLREQLSYIEKNESDWASLPRYISNAKLKNNKDFEDRIKGVQVGTSQDKPQTESQHVKDLKDRLDQENFKLWSLKQEKEQYKNQQLGYGIIQPSVLAVGKESSGQTKDRNNALNQKYNQFEINKVTQGNLARGAGAESEQVLYYAEELRRYKKLQKQADQDKDNSIFDENSREDIKGNIERLEKLIITVDGVRHQVKEANDEFSRFGYGFKGAADKMGEQLLKLEGIGAKVAQGLSEGFADVFMDTLSGADSFGDAMRKMFATLLNDLSRQILSGVFAQAMGKMAGQMMGQQTFNQGGFVARKADGQQVYGSSEVPTLLTGGEFVAQPDLVRKHGVDFFTKINNGAVDLQGVRGGDSPSSQGEFVEGGNGATDDQYRILPRGQFVVRKQSQNRYRNQLSMLAQGGQVVGRPENHFYGMLIGGILGGVIGGAVQKKKNRLGGILTGAALGAAAGYGVGELMGGQAVAEGAQTTGLQYSNQAPIAGNNYAPNTLQAGWQNSLQGVQEASQVAQEFTTAQKIAMGVGAAGVIGGSIYLNKYQQDKAKKKLKENEIIERDKSLTGTLQYQEFDSKGNFKRGQTTTTGPGEEFFAQENYMVKSDINKYLEKQKTLRGYATGGIVQRDQGGQVFYGSQTRDNVPAVLKNGEYVLNDKAVNHYGIDYISKLNSRQISKDQVRGYSDGGQVNGAQLNIGQIESDSYSNDQSVLQKKSSSNSDRQGVNVTIVINTNGSSEITGDAGDNDKQKWAKIAKKMEPFIRQTIADETRTGGSVKGQK